VSHNIPLLSIFTIRGKLLCASLHANCFILGRHGRSQIFVH
jgi:hypothetical protein